MVVTQILLPTYALLVIALAPPAQIVQVQIVFLAQFLCISSHPQNSVFQLVTQTNISLQLLLLPAKVATPPARPAQEDLLPNAFLAVVHCFTSPLQILVLQLALMDSTKTPLTTYALPVTANAQLAVEVLILNAFLAQSLDSIKQPQQAACSLAIQTNTNHQLRLLFV